MNRMQKMVAAAALLLAPALASAQSNTRPIGFGISGGLSLPTGDLGDGYDAGYSIAGHVFLKPATTRALGFRGDVSYDRFEGKNDRFSTSSLGVMLNAVLDVSSSTSGIKPYLLGGLGLVRREGTVEVGGVEVSDSDSDLGVQVGGGLRFQLSGFSTFLEAKYVNVFADPNNVGYIPITFGFRF